MTAQVLVHPTARDAAPESEVEAKGLVPPHDLDVEAAVISAVLLDPAALPRIEDFLEHEHFYSEAHRRIYEAAIAVKLAGSPVDATTVGSWLKDNRRLTQVGGLEYIGSILGCSPVVANVRAHAVIVFDHWRVRRMMLLCGRALAHGYQAGEPQVYLDGVVKHAAEIARRTPGEKGEDNFAMLRRIVRQMNDAAAAKGEKVEGRGIPTGIKSIDEEILGLFAGQKTSIIAPPRVGKTALGYQIAINVAREGIVVGVWSTEMQREELGIRQLSLLASIDSKRLQRAMQENVLTPEEWNRLAIALDAEKDFKSSIEIFDDTNVTVEDIAAGAKALQERAMHTHGRPLGLVVVDYIQNLKASKNFEHRKKNEQVAHATKRLKDLAKELKIHVIELAQSKVSEVDKGKGCRPHPQLFDAADSAVIERSANTAIHLWRPKERDGGHVKACIVKQRSGEEPDIDLRFHREFSRFEPLPFGPMTPVSRGYVDYLPEPPPGRFDDEER